MSENAKTLAEAKSLAKELRTYGRGFVDGPGMFKDAADMLIALASKVEALEADAARMDTLEENFDASIFRLGETWYWRKGYQQPHRKTTSLRKAVDAFNAQANASRAEGGKHG